MGGSLLARIFGSIERWHAFTRREAEKAKEERDVIPEVRRAQVERIYAINDFMIHLFVHIRKKQAAYIIMDLDPTADPTPGQQ